MRQLDALIHIIRRGAAATGHTTPTSDNTSGDNDSHAHDHAGTSEPADGEHAQPDPNDADRDRYDTDRDGDGYDGDGYDGDGYDGDGYDGDGYDGDVRGPGEAVHPGTAFGPDQTPAPAAPSNGPACRPVPSWQRALDPHLLIITTLDQLADLTGSGAATTDRTGALPPHLLTLLACTATLTRIITDPHGVPLHVGRQQRLLTPGQRKALTIRDRGCIIPGCPVPAADCHAHHITPWSHGGPTNLDNLALLCWRHHQQTHAGIWEITIRDGIPWIKPPHWIDPHQRPRRNTLPHLKAHTHTTAQKLAHTLNNTSENHATRQNSAHRQHDRENDKGDP
jgi:hypothetical protein